MVTPSFEVSAADGARLEIADYYIEGDVLVPGTEAVIHMTVKNFSESYDAFNAYMTLSTDSGKIYPIYGNDNQYYIGTLGRGQEKEIEVKARIADDLNSSVVDLACSFAIRTNEDTTYNTTYLVLPVKAGTPAIIDIDSFSLDSGVLVAGKESVLRLNIHNLSQTASAENIVMTLTDYSGQVFPAYGTDNQYPIGQLDKDETRTIEIPLSVSNDFASRDLGLECSFTYSGESGSASNTLSIVLPSTESAPVVAKSIELSQSAIINSQTLLSITLWNNSSEGISYACLLIDGNVSEESKKIELSTLYSQQNYSEDCHVVFTEGGNQQIGVVLKYTDLNGQERESNLGTYTVNVGSTAEKYRVNFSNRILKYIGWAIAAFGVLASCYVFVQYAKKRL